MRLTPHQISTILECTREHINADITVWLFGSRVDDSAKGGDIDLMIETPELPNPVERKIKLKLALAERLGDEKIDILLHDRNLPLAAIHRIAKEEGVELTG